MFVGVHTAISMHTCTLHLCSKYRGLGAGDVFFQFYFEIVFLRQNHLKWQLFIWKSDCRLESPCVHLVPWNDSCRTTWARAVCCMGFWHIHCFYCGVWAWGVVSFLVLWVLLFACSPHSPGEQTGPFPGDPPLGYFGKSPLRKVLSPTHITRHPQGR